jgi:hypothetical protein
MTSRDPTYQLDVKRTCALCDGRVTLVQGGLSHREANATSTPYWAVAWCRLQPCGHLFAVRNGGLIR